MTTWKTGELGKFITLKRGYDLPQQKRKNGGVPIFSSSGISGTHDTAMVKAPGVITGRYGTIGQVFMADEDFWPLNTTLYVEDFHGNNPRFIYYFLKTLGWEKFTSASAVPGINRNTVHKETICLPDIATQDKIASVLTTLDDKIEINEKINDNLQQQLRTIFRAKFTDNPELERIERKPLSELCNVVTKGTTPTTLGKSFVESGINFIKAESILDDHSIDKSKFAFIDEETNTLLKRSVIHAGDVVFTIAGTLGRFALIDDSVLPANTNQAVAIIRVDAKKILPEYIYTCFIGGWHTDYYTKRVQQAVQANLSLTTIKSLPIPVLDKGEMDEYLRLILPIIKAIKGNEAQNENLAMLRDSLLPKLMSGEIDVSNIQL